MTRSSAIARILTPPGEAAIAVVHVEGPALAATMRAWGVRALPRVGATGLRRLDLGGGLYEDALLVVPGASSLEIHVHGNQRLVERLMTALRRLGVECPGIDSRSETPHATLASLRAEILGAAREAPSRIGLEACLAQLGSDGLLELAADASARRPESWDEVDARGRALAPFLVPRRVVLRGPTNVGKSTLFNLLLGRTRVRVGRDAGLTRDTVEELVVLEGGVPILLVDVAGEREVQGGEGDRGLDASLERRAIEAGASIRRSADLVLALRSCEEPHARPPTAGELTVFTHADRVRPDGSAAAPPGDAIRCSLTQDDPADVVSTVGRAIRAGLGIVVPSPGPAWIGDRSRAFVAGCRRAGTSDPAR